MSSSLLMPQCTSPSDSAICALLGAAAAACPFLPFPAPPFFFAPSALAVLRPVASSRTRIPTENRFIISSNRASEPLPHRCEAPGADLQLNHLQVRHSIPTALH